MTQTLHEVLQRLVGKTVTLWFRGGSESDGVDVEVVSVGEQHMIIGHQGHRTQQRQLIPLQEVGCIDLPDDFDADQPAVQDTDAAEFDPGRVGAMLRELSALADKRSNGVYGVRITPDSPPIVQLWAEEYTRHFADAAFTAEPLTFAVGYEVQTECEGVQYWAVAYERSALYDKVHAQWQAQEQAKQAAATEAPAAPPEEAT